MWGERALQRRQQGPADKTDAAAAGRRAREAQDSAAAGGRGAKDSAVVPCVKDAPGGVGAGGSIAAPAGAGGYAPLALYSPDARGSAAWAAGASAEGSAGGPSGGSASSAGGPSGGSAGGSAGGASGGSAGGLAGGLAGGFSRGAMVSRARARGAWCGIVCIICASRARGSCSTLVGPVRYHRLTLRCRCSASHLLHRRPRPWPGTVGHGNCSARGREAATPSVTGHHLARHIMTKRVREIDEELVCLVFFLLFHAPH